MDFQPTEEQAMLVDSLRRYLTTAYPFEERRRVARQQRGFERRHWQALADLGILGLTVPVDDGGFGETAATQLLVHRELGRALLAEPVIPSAVMATAVLTAWAGADIRAAWLPTLADGSRIVSVAWQETGSRYSPARTTTTVTEAADGLVLDGSKCLVWHGGVADAFLVLAQAQAGVGLLLVPRDHSGVEITDYPTLDGSRAADLRFRQVHLPASAWAVAPPQGLSALDHGLDHGVAALCAGAVGAMEKLLDLTIDYVRTRQQFGRPLGALQVVQHRVADMLVQKELALSMAYVAAQALDEPPGDTRRRMLSGAKLVIARAGRMIGQSAVQLHGGMGMTDELAVGDYFKHLTMCDALLGDSDHHLQRYVLAMRGPAT